MVRISPQIMMELTTADTRMIAKAIIGENIGGAGQAHTPRSYTRRKKWEEGWALCGTT